MRDKTIKLSRSRKISTNRVRSWCSSSIVLIEVKVEVSVLELDLVVVLIAPGCSSKLHQS